MEFGVKHLLHNSLHAPVYGVYMYHDTAGVIHILYF